MTDDARDAILDTASRKGQAGAVTAKKSKSQEVRAEQRDKTEKKSIYETLKGGFERIAPLRNAAGSLKGKGQESEEVVAKAMGGGPFFEAAMEIKGAVDNIRTGLSPEPSTTAKVVGKSTTMTDIPAVRPGEKPTARETGPGSSEKQDHSQRTNDTHVIASREKNKGKEPPAVTARPVESGKGAANSPEGAKGPPATTAEVVAIASTDEAEEIIGVLESLMSIAAKSQLLDEKHSAMLIKTIEKRSLAQYWEMAMTVKSIADKVRDPSSDLRKGAGKIAGKFGFGNRIRTKQTTGRQEEATATAAITTVTIANPESMTDAIIAELQAVEKEDKKRHGELIKAILQGSKGSAGAGMPYSRNMGPGARGRERRLGRIEGRQRRVTATPRAPRAPRATGGGLLSALPGATLPGGNRPAGGGLDDLASMAMKVAPALAAMAALPLGAIAAGVGATAAAIGAVGAAGYSAVTGKDNFISKGAQKLGLVPKLETDASGKVVAGAVAEAQESGGGDKGAGVISSGKNDAGGKSYGLKQFSSKKGKNGKSSVGEYVKASKYAQEFEGLEPGSAAFDKKWDEVNKRDNKGFAADQRDYTNKTMTAPIKALAAQKGFATSDVGMREAITSQSINHGQAGNKTILNNAEAELTAKYGSVAAAPAQEQLDAVYKSRKAYANSVAAGKEAKGDAKSLGEAKQLRKMAGVGGRYDKENAITKELSATGGIIGKTVTAQKSKATEPSLVEGEASQQAGEVPAPTVAEATFASAPPAPIQTARAVTDGRKRIMARNRERLAAAGAGSLAPKPIAGAMAETTIADTKAAPQEPVASLASAVTARPSPPERMTTTARADTVMPGKQTQGPVSQGGMDMSGAFMAAIAKLNSAVSKMAEGKDEAARLGGQQIRTEFDDTMLTLMAYDRV